VQWVKDDTVKKRLKLDLRGLQVQMIFSFVALLS
jgi:hypothetical protein